ncbi:MAG: B-box zinc finger protein [Anaerolineales bacterium]
MNDLPTLTCANHPNVATTLRCNKCDKPICAKCAVRTPTGYRCKECVRRHQQSFDATFNTARWYDYLIALMLPALLSLAVSIGVAFLTLFVWGLIVLILAPSAGELIARLTQAALRRHRSRPLYRLVAAGVILGALPVSLFLLLTGGWFILVWEIIYLVIAVPVVYYRISGIRLS